MTSNWSTIENSMKPGLSIEKLTLEKDLSILGILNITGPSSSIFLAQMCFVNISEGFPQQVSEMSLDVAKLKKAAQKWQNNANAMEKVSSKEMFEIALAEKLRQQTPTSNVRMMDR